MLARERLAEGEIWFFQIGGGTVQDQNGGVGRVAIAAVMQACAVNLEKLALRRMRPGNAARNQPAAKGAEKKPRKGNQRDETGWRHRYSVRPARAASMRALALTAGA